MTARFCVGCRWHIGLPLPVGAETVVSHACHVPQNDPVTGFDTTATTDCWTMRHANGPCGPEGRLWEGKPE